MAFFGRLTFESRRPVNSWSRKTPPQVAVIVEEGPSQVRSQSSIISNNFWTLLIQLAPSESEKRQKWPRSRQQHNRLTNWYFNPSDNFNVSIFGKESFIEHTFQSVSLHCARQPLWRQLLGDSRPWPARPDVRQAVRLRRKQQTNQKILPASPSKHFFYFLRLYWEKIFNSYHYTLCSLYYTFKSED